MRPGLWETCFWLWGPLLWLSIGSSGNVPPTTQPKCTDFQSANLLRGTNLKVQFLLFTPFFHAGYNYLICDHMRAVHLYISALENTCPLMAFPCASYKAFLAGDCLDCFNPFLLSCPRIGLVERGGVMIEPLPKEVKVYLLTTSSAPYCVHHSLVEFYLKEKRKKDTSIEVTFLSNNVTSSVKITIPKQQREGRGVMAHPNPQCQINQVKLKFQVSSRVWRKDRTPVVGTFCTAPLPVNDSKKTVCIPEPVRLQAGVPAFQDLKIACV